MNNRIEIAQNFANAINSDKIIRIILFGSVARREDDEESDIDILIISNEWEQIDSLITDEVFNECFTFIQLQHHPLKHFLGKYDL